MRDNKEIIEAGMTANTRKLLTGLLDMGVEFVEPAWNYRISRNYGQGMMNKAAGEAAPTWELKQDMESYYSPSTKRWRHGGGKYPKLRFEGRDYALGIGSSLPLTWILKFGPKKWQLTSETGYQLVLLVDQLPPSWAHVRRT